MYDIWYLPGAIIAVLMYNKLSLKMTIWIATTISTTGSIITVLAAWKLSFIFIGDFMWSIVHEMIIFGSPLLATNWFEDSKRIIVISVSYIVTFIASDHSFGLNNLMLNNFEEQNNENRKKALLLLFLIKAALWSFVCIIAYFTFKSKPAVPPSEAATVYRDDDILGTIRQLFANKQFMLLSLSHLFYYTSFNIMKKNLEEMVRVYLYPISYNEKEQLKLSITAGAVLGSLSLGVFLHLTKCYKTANILLGILSFIGWVLIPFVFKMNLTCVSMLYGFIGFTSFSITPFWYIYSVEIAYPLKETTVVGIVKGISAALSGSIAYILYYFILKHNDENSWTVIVTIMAISTALGLLTAMMIKPINYEAIRGGDICKF